MENIQNSYSARSHLINDNSSGNSGSDYLSSPISQKLLKLTTLSLSGLYSHIHRLETREHLKRVLAGGEELKEGRYYVYGLIGSGSFGKVVEAFDRERNEKVAIKIIKHKLKLAKIAQREIDTLKKLNEYDQEKGYIVRMLDHFEWNGHTCIVFEYLSKTLLQLLRDTDFKGLSLSEVRDFAWQLVLALCLLSRPKLKIIHCDLKPENIMLKVPDRSGIKIVDFGSSCEVGKTIYKCVQSMYYRAPEVILGQTYGASIDVWSVGCILAELHIGRPLFCGRTEIDQMAKITEILGMPPYSMIFLSEKIHTFFDVSGPPKLKHEPIHEDPNKQYPKSLKEALGIHIVKKDAEKYQNFLDLIQKMLEYNPNKRISPIDALEHQFFKDGNIDGVIKYQAPPLKHVENPVKRPTSLSMIHSSEVPWPSNNFPCCAPKKYDNRYKIPWKPFVYPSQGTVSTMDSHDTSPYSKQSTSGSQASSWYQSPLRINSTEEIEIALKNAYGNGNVIGRPASHNMMQNIYVTPVNNSLSSRPASHDMMGFPDVSKNEF
ncbi:DYRK1A_2 [Blepharisma stoltei]|uniref:Protein kinase domain-containing protein n=1 Tax=Blepharisma stoltei TaxID=1481888 RepID=A0AAU9JK91_9CILI|nr:unnamed protein product [Blepharisma stoltei]